MFPFPSFLGYFDQYSSFEGNLVWCQIQSSLLTGLRFYCSLPFPWSSQGWILKTIFHLQRGDVWAPGGSQHRVLWGTLEWCWLDGVIRAGGWPWLKPADLGSVSNSLTNTVKWVNLTHCSHLIRSCPCAQLCFADSPWNPFSACVELWACTPLVVLWGNWEGIEREKQWADFSFC